MNDKIVVRAKNIGNKLAPIGFPVGFLSLGIDGIGVPVCATIAIFGPILLSKIL
ncbi:helicase HerA-like domain-containing protein [Mycobacterium uberis]|uniref:helicase HerA-like domain-containing protein n=1 Tax=Mycobacterium uberis TaxID=2162698 RepID=UPI002436A757|nr:helicase HerA-like domain-containing protein [Mycobacterium uberis]